MRLSGSTARAETLPSLPARPGQAVVVRGYSLKLSVAQSLAHATGASSTARRTTSIQRIEIQPESRHVETESTRQREN